MFKHSYFDPFWLIAYSLLIIAIVGGGYFFIFESNGNNVATIEVMRGDVIHEVKFTGTIVPAQKVAVGFERSGRVVLISADVGEVVREGALLASLDTAENEARLIQSQADLESAEATLRKLKSGTRPEEIRVQEIKVENAETVLEGAQQHLADILQSSFTIVDDVIADDVDQFFTNPDGILPQVIFLTDLQSKLNIENSRLEFQDTLTRWEVELLSLEATDSLTFKQSDTRFYITQAAQLLVHAGNALNNAIPSPTASQDILDGWIGEIGVARGIIDGATTVLSQAEEEFNDAQSSVLLAREQLALLAAGTITEDIDAQEAVVRAKGAYVTLLETELAKSSIYAPIAGIITQKTIERGELATANVTVFSIISDASYEVDAHVSELDIASLFVDAPAAVTLESYGTNEIFETAITHIDPAETFKSNVPAYGVTLQFIKDDARIRSGMTANVTVRTGVRRDALYIPSRGIKRSGDTTTVSVYSDGITTEKKVTTGLRGTNGNIEIIEGLNEGERILVQ